MGFCKQQNNFLKKKLLSTPSSHHVHSLCRLHLIFWKGNLGRKSVMKTVYSEMCTERERKKNDWRKFDLRNKQTRWNRRCRCVCQRWGDPLGRS